MAKSLYGQHIIKEIPLDEFLTESDGHISRCPFDKLYSGRKRLCLKAVAKKKGEIPLRFCGEIINHALFRPECPGAYR
jgi:hypothetical protein